MNYFSSSLMSSLIEKKIHKIKHATLFSANLIESQGNNSTEYLNRCSYSKFTLYRRYSDFSQANLVLKQWRDFKRRVPVYGAMLITPDRKNVLLVEGNSTRGCWTFPRGELVF